MLKYGNCENDLRIYGNCENDLLIYDNCKNDLLNYDISENDLLKYDNCENDLLIDLYQRSENKLPLYGCQLNKNYVFIFSFLPYRSLSGAYATKSKHLQGVFPRE